MRKIVFLSVLVLLASTQHAIASQAEMASGRSDKPVVQAEKFLAVTAHPQATAAAHQTLKQGGSAVDAAIAAQMVLTLVEPQSSGIGGGGFMLHYSARKSRLQAYDGRETAPASALPSLFLDENDQPLSGAQASADPRSVGVPGLLAMLGMAHRQHGRLPWASLMQAAIELAENGFVISPRLHRLISKDRLICKRNSTRAYFCDDNGQAKPSGSLLQNPLLAGSLRQIASQGPSALQSGPLADALIDMLHKTTPDRAGLTHADLQNYRAVERTPLCRPYRQYRICGMPPPSAGAVAILQMLNMLQQKDIGQHKPDSVEAIHLFSEAGRLAFADRERYIADPDTSAIPLDGLLDNAYLAQRAALIKSETSIGTALPGTPATAPTTGSDAASGERPSTSHMTILDRYGNMVALTSSIADAFGSRLMVRGFLLNSQLADFSFQPFVDGQPVANRVGAGKRPRSAMSPIMVLDRQQKPLLVLGSAGGPNIINHLAQTLLGVLEWQQPLQSAIGQYHYGSRNGLTELEYGQDWSHTMSGLQERGHRIETREITSGLHGIQRHGKYWHSGTDPRREGVASGE